MAISNLSSGLRPGVCTSTTRPTAPFEGQMIYETDTNRVLVWDNAAWVMIADTDTPPGLELIKTQTVGSAVSSVPINDVFSATYESYRITLNGIIQSTDSPNCLFQLSNITGSVYYGAGNYYAWANTTINHYSPAVSTSWLIGTIGTEGTGISMDIHNPNLAKAKFMSAFSSDKSFQIQVGGRCASTTQSTGFTISAASGTMTGGTIRVYGYRNS